MTYSEARVSPKYLIWFILKYADKLYYVSILQTRHISMELNLLLIQMDSNVRLINTIPTAAWSNYLISMMFVDKNKELRIIIMSVSVH